MGQEQGWRRALSLVKWGRVHPAKEVDFILGAMGHYRRVMGRGVAYQTCTLGSSIWLQHGEGIRKEDREANKGAVEDPSVRQPGSHAICSRSISLGPGRHLHVQSCGLAILPAL